MVDRAAMNMENGRFSVVDYILFRTLAKLFSKRDQLSVLSRGTNRRSFVSAIIVSDVNLLAALQSEGLDADALTQEDLLAEIERSAKDLDNRNNFETFHYMQNDVRCLPFFSTMEHAQKFCGEYSKERNRVFPFQMLGVRGSVLTTQLPYFDKIILNPRSADEYILTEADMKLLEEMG